MTHADRNLLGKLLHHILHTGLLRHIEVADASLAPISGAINLPVPRLSIVLAGTRKMVIARHGQSREILLEEGDLLFSLPGGWTKPVYPYFCASLGVVFHPDYTRVLFHTAKQRENRGPGPEHWYHILRQRDPSINSLLSALEFEAANVSLPAAVNPMFQALLWKVLEMLNCDEKTVSRSLKSWQNIAAYIYEHCDEELTRDDVAAVFNLHPNHVSRLFRQHCREGFSAFLRRLRMERACVMLRNRTLTIREIASRCGFSSSAYFVRSFRHH
ncbi:MAG: AraC family transcriptional regulator, partial [Lentisphaerae bacterium]